MRSDPQKREERPRQGARLNPEKLDPPRIPQSAIHEGTDVHVGSTSGGSVALAEVVSLEAYRNRRARRAALLAAMEAPDQTLEARCWGERRGA